MTDSNPISATLYAAADAAAAHGRRETVFVLDNVADWQTLANGVPTGVEVVVLDSRGDGLQQMADWLAQKPPGSVDAIHLLGHGSSGSVDLGTLTLSSANLSQHSDSLGQIGSALTSDGDFLLYGCNVADGQLGLALVGQLAQATGADVAASLDLTGAADQGGDWVLESQTGPLEATSHLLFDYNALLGVGTPFEAETIGFITLNMGTTRLGNGGHADVYVHQVSGNNKTGESLVYAPKIVLADANNHIIQTIQPDTSIDEHNVCYGIAASALENGGFVVVWTVVRYDEEWNVNSADSYYRIYDNAGDPQGNSVLIRSDGLPDMGFRPAVAGLPDGGFAVAVGTKDIDLQRLAVVTYTHDAGNFTKANEVVIGSSVAYDFSNATDTNLTLSNLSGRPQIAVLSDGSFVVQEGMYLNGSNGSFSYTPLGDYLFKFDSDGAASNFTSGYSSQRLNWNEHSNNGTSLIALSGGGFASIHHGNDTQNDWQLSIFQNDGTSVIGNTKSVNVNNGTEETYHAITVASDATNLSIAITSNFDRVNMVQMPNGNLVIALPTASNQGFDLYTYSPLGVPISGPVSLGLTADDGYEVENLRMVPRPDGSGVDFTYDQIKKDATNGTTSVAYGYGVYAPPSAPTVTATGESPTFDQGGSTGVDLFDAVTAETNDSGQTFTGAQFTVTHVADTTEYLTINGVDVALTNGNTATLPGLGVLSGNAAASVVVSAGTATIVITDLSLDNTAMGTLIDGVTYKNSDSSVTTGDRVITLTEVTDSGSSNQTASLSLAATVSVVSVDTTPPTLNGAGSTPVDNATAVAIGGDVVIDFSENIAFGASGTITLRNVTGNTTAETFDVSTVSGGTVTGSAGSTLSISDDKLTLNPSDNLKTGTQYSLQFTAGSLVDTAETPNELAAISDDTTYHFTTAAPTVTLSVNPTPIAEATGSSTVTATLSAAASTDTVVTLTASGTATGSDADYSLGSTSLTILAGQTTSTTTVTAVQDALDEPDETIILDITGVSGGGGASESGAQQVTVTITDDDAPPSLSIADASVSEGDSGDTPTMTFTVTLSAASGKTVTVNYTTSDSDPLSATSGEDYAAEGNTLTFAPGETSKTFSVLIGGDTDQEGNETFDVVLSNASNATIANGTATGTILDDDNAPPSLDLNGGGTGTNHEVTLASAANGLAAASALASDAELDVSGWDGATLSVQRVTAAGEPDACEHDVYSFTASSLFAATGTIAQGSDSTGTLTTVPGGTAFATWSYTDGALSINFNVNATSALVQDVVRHVGYSNDRPYGDATIRMALSDGTSTTNADVTVTSTTIHVDKTTLDADGDAADGFNLKEALAIAQDGDTILIHDGVYRGQFSVTKAVTIDALDGADGNVTIEAPDTADLQGVDPFQLSNIGRWRMPVLDLQTSTPGSGTVTVKNITIDGRYQALVDGFEANKDLVGIGVFNTNALIDGVTVKNIADRSDGAYANTDENFGILAEGSSALSTPVTVTVQNSDFQTFQRTGIVAWGAKLHANILDNTFTGTGVSSLTVQNAIQIGSFNSNRAGTTGTVKGNTFTGLDTANDNGYLSSGVVLSNAGAVEIAHNHFGAGTREEAANQTVGITVMAPLAAVNIHDNTFANLAYGISFEHYEDSTLGLDHQVSHNNFADTQQAIDFYLSPSSVTTTNTLTVTQASTAPTNASGHLVFVLQDNGDSFSDTGSAPTQVTGGTGNDTVSGGSGADTLSGGAGNDHLTGGAGNDVFEYAGTGNGVDTITDFGAGDAIQVVGRASTGGTVTAGDGTTVAANSVQVSSSDGTTTLYIDSDGVADAPELEIKLTGTFVPGHFALDGEFIRLNTAPTLSGVPSSVQVVETGSAAPLADFSVSDAEGDTLTVTLIATNGTIGGLTDDDGSTAGIQIIGLASDVNAELAGATFSASAAGVARIDIGVSDGVADAISDTYTLAAIVHTPGSPYDLWQGSSGNDTLCSGSNRPDSIEGLAGNDSLCGDGGADTLNGGTGADTMNGGDGDDTYHVDDAGDVVIESGSNPTIGGRDTVITSLADYTLGVNIENGRIASTGAANLKGNSLANVLWAGVGDNVIDAGAAIDTLSYEFGVSEAGGIGVTVSLAVAGTQNTGGSGWDTLVSLENLTGSAFADSLTGSNAANTLLGLTGHDSLYGLGGNDSLNGGEGNDSLDGGAGNDTLEGGLGLDALLGGSGSDVFVWRSVAETGTTAETADVIADFTRGQDKLDLSVIDADTRATAGGNQAFGAPVVGGAFSGTFTGTRQLYFDTTTGTLYGNNDADAQADFAIKLVGVSTLAGGDLVKRAEINGLSFLR